MDAWREAGGPNDGGGLDRLPIALFHLGGVILVLTLPGHLWLREPVWTLSPEAVPQCLLMGLAYLAGVAAVLIAGDRRSTRLRVAIGATSVAFVVVFGARFLRPDLPFSRGVFMVAAALSVALVTGYEIGRSRRRFRAVAPALALVAATGVVGVGIAVARPSVPGDAGFVRTAHHLARVTYLDSLVAEEDVHEGGAIGMIGAQVVGVTGSGAFYVLTRNDGEASGRRLALESPSNLAAFDSSAPTSVSRDGFRVLDFAVRPSNGGWDLFVSHHHWHEDRACLVVRVSRTWVDADLDAPDASNTAWRSLFETTPCVSVEENALKPPLAGIASGGRLAWIDDRGLLMTVGDLEKAEFAQIDSVDFGKTVLIDADDGSAGHYTTGHRNAEGLIVDADGSVWSTEHGPMGGDELNLIRPGANYGWPAESYGTEYGRYEWEALPGVEAPEHSTEPVFSWVPAIGVSSLIRIRGVTFFRWSGDLLVASLRARSLYRLRLVDDRVVYAEPIQLERRIRDLVEDDEGTIWLWGEDVVAMVETGEDADRGDELMASCAQCHLVGYVSGMMAPTLYGVVDRRVASRRDYEYSDALRGVGGRWTEERLDAFLTSPARFAPGNTMVFPGLSDPEDRAAVIAHLLRLAQ